MRLFIAINLSEETKDALAYTQSLLREHAASARYSARENMHLTLAFIGETPGSAVNNISAALDEADGAPFTMTLGEAGAFRSGVWWVGVEKCGALNALQRSVVSALTSHNVSYDKRAFSPHLTIAREVELRQGAAPLLDVPPVAECVDRISLMKSERQSGRLVYTEIYTKLLSEGI